MGKKKVLLFIVEGMSDEKALAVILQDIFSSVHFHTIIARGDVTAKYLNRNTNIVNKVREMVLNNLKRLRIFEATDLATVCLLTDLDGCFVADSQVAPHDQEDNIYSRNCIYARNVEKQIKTKNFKATNLKILSSKKYLTISTRKIPFVCYYMSCNLEDVFHGEQNYTDDEKSYLADEVADYYQRDIGEFIRFLETQYPLSFQDYSKSWQYPQKGNRSLERHTNFLLFLLDHQNYLSPKALKALDEIQIKEEPPQE